MPSPEPTPLPGDQPPERPTADRSAAMGTPRILRSEELLQGAREVWIEHGADMYRLRLTNNGRLYLSK